jgi:hypothetical protein
MVDSCARITWDDLEEMIDDTLCASHINYLLEDNELIRHDFVEGDKKVAWFRYKRKYIDLYREDEFESRLEQIKKFKYS